MDHSADPPPPGGEARPRPPGDRRRRRSRVVAATLSPLLLSLTACPPPPPPPLPPETPRLVLFVVVDQLRAEYLSRFDSLFTGGFRRLLDESVSFTEAHHEHALTVTAPGHASLASGLFPSHHGVISNGWYRPDGEWVYCVGDETDRRSPRNLLGSTLGDWLKQRSPASKVFGASGKDRGAILMAGARADGAFWYDQDDGSFTSSSYYARPEPPWLAAFNQQALAVGTFARPWEPLPAAAAAGPELGIEALDGGLFQQGFPHLPGGMALAPDEDFYAGLHVSPFVDVYLARLAEAIVLGEDLGGDGAPDLLALSFSATDTVGHDWGPNSREVLDTLLRLDQTLGELLDFLDRSIGLDRVLIALSSDHGVAPLPEYQQLHGLPGRRLTTEDALCLRQRAEALADRAGGIFALDAYGFLRPEAREAAGMTEAEMEAEIRRLADGCLGVVRLWTRSELLAGEELADPTGRLYARSFHRERSPDVLVQYEEGYLPYLEVRTTHGSPYRYDTHVPWLLRLPAGSPGVVGERVATVDVAPTLAALLGVPVPAGRDGVDRSGLLPGSTDDAM